MCVLACGMGMGLAGWAHVMGGWLPSVRGRLFLDLGVLKNIILDFLQPGSATRCDAMARAHH